MNAKVSIMVVVRRGRMEIFLREFLKTPGKAGVLIKDTPHFSLAPVFALPSCLHD